MGTEETYLTYPRPLEKSKSADASRVILVNGIDMLDIITDFSKKNKRYIANTLKDLEQVLGKDTKEYIAVRKLFLDNFNDFTRALLVQLFGNIEGLY